MKFPLSEYNVFSANNSDLERWARYYLTSMMQNYPDAPASISSHNLPSISAQDIDALETLVLQRGRLIAQAVSKNGTTKLFAGTYTVYLLSYGNTNTAAHVALNAMVCGITADEVAEFAKEIEVFRKPVVHDTNKISLVVQQSHGPDFRSVNIKKLPLIRDNYAPVIRDQYDHILADITSAAPSGRLAILEGPPGTGKTSFIRGLLNEKLNSRVVFLPSNLLVELSGPGLVSLFLPDEDSRPDGDDDQPQSDGRTVVILEDADDCLVTRDVDKMSVMTNLLNLTDGILGEAANLFIVATTNTPIKDFDSALLRPGRLSSYVKFGPITDWETALSIFKRIHPDHDTNLAKNNEFRAKFRDGGATLADIYNVGNGSGATLEAPVRVGFGNG